MTSKKIKILILLALIIAGISEGCKKYEEGPCISLRFAEKRIYGTYTLTKYTVNGDDSLSLFNDSLYNVLSFFYNDYSELNDCEIKGYRNDGKISNLIWSWKLENENKTHKVTSSSCYAGTVGWPSGTGPFINGATPEWELLRLTNKEIKMKTNYNKKEYLVELKEN